MARIAGVDLPRQKHINIALTYIYGIGHPRAGNILDEAKVDPMKKVQDLSDEEVLAAFRKIPEAYREVVLLSDVYEFSYKEIQQTLNIPIGTVMSRLSRGRQLLRTHLADVAIAVGYQKKAATAV